MIAIFSGEYYQVMNAKNILLDNDIEVFVENEIMGTLDPWLLTAGGYKSVNLKVNEADVEKAKELISFLAE